MTDLPANTNPANADPADIDLLAAALRADSAELDVYARVLTASLADALPASMVEVAHDQSLRDRLAGRPGTVTTVRILLGEMTLELGRGRSGAPVARVARTVRDVTISTKEVSVEEWTKMLASELAARSQESASARAALARLVGTT